MDTTIQTDKFGKVRVADELKILYISDNLDVSSVVKKTSVKEFVSEMTPYMSGKLYNVLTWSADDLLYLENITKKRFFRIINAGKKSYQEFLSVKEKYYSLKNTLLK